jgi:hypothetical protein
MSSPADTQSADTSKQAATLVVRTFNNGSTGEFINKSCLVWCPGCDDLHKFNVEGESPTWTWNGNETRPTFSPSYLTWRTVGNDLPVDHPNYQETQQKCHSYLEDGMCRTDRQHGTSPGLVDEVSGTCDR